jgi:hypothetical protein
VPPGMGKHLQYSRVQFSVRPLTLNKHDTAPSGVTSGLTPAALFSHVRWVSRSVMLPCIPNGSHLSRSFCDLGVESIFMCLMAQSLMMCLVRGNVQPLTSVYMVSKSPRPAPSSHWPLDSLANFGSWDSRASDAKISCSQYR